MHEASCTTLLQDDNTCFWLLLQLDLAASEYISE